MEVAGMMSKQELSKWLDMVGMLGEGIIWERRSGKSIRIEIAAFIIVCTNLSI